ncbi:DNA circularization protein [Otariodibacter oris]|nr:DNA circularization N-terminal domain-containing protein [Otariodibacter oris]QGM80658.1 hypothetical protein A6A10_04195 [Otariodibacter oris]
MGWTVPIQRASYRGVRFDVLSITDSLDKSLVEHSYPFVDGVDLEDMGLNARTVQMQAVFFGEGYNTDLNKLVSVLQKQGADVLVHPVFGRMPNMICSSASLRHEADYVDYVALDLNFIEATPAKPIFLFQSQIGQIDELISKLEDTVDLGMNFWANSVSSMSVLYNWKSRLLNSWGAIHETFSSIRELFDLDKNKYKLSSAISMLSYQEKSANAILNIKEMIDVGVANVADRYSLTSTSKIRNVNEATSAVKKIPLDLVKNETYGKSKLIKLNEGDVIYFSAIVDFFITIKLIQFSTLLIEDKGDILTAFEIEKLNHDVRLNALDLINKVRHIQHEDQKKSESAKTTAIYQATEKLTEELKSIVHKFKLLAITTINKKPPLIVRKSEVSGTIHQVAHHFYQDYRRADELLLLNPQIAMPNFIKAEDLLNAYTK